MDLGLFWSFSQGLDVDFVPTQQVHKPGQERTYAAGDAVPWDAGRP